MVRCKSSLTAFVLAASVAAVTLFAAGCGNRNKESKKDAMRAGMLCLGEAACACVILFVPIESAKLSLHLREQDIFSVYHNLQHDSRRFHKKCSLDC